MNAPVVYTALLLALSSCHAKSPISDQLVGRWQSAVTLEDGSTTAAEMVFMPDGTYSWGFPTKPGALTGRWRVEGQDLLFTVEKNAPDSGFPSLPPEFRNHIVRISAHEFVVIGSDTTEGRWTR